MIVIVSPNFTEPQTVQFFNKDIAVGSYRDFEAYYPTDRQDAKAVVGNAVTLGAQPVGNETRDLLAN